ncbi:MAG TPA: iron uptake porin, partial [Oculatellaceae cyanobacterium]
MSTIFWKALKLSPALLGASLVFASSTYAREIVTDQTATTTTNQSALQEKLAVDPLTETTQTKVVASNTNAVHSVPNPTATTSTNQQVAAQEKPTVDPLTGMSQNQVAAQEKPTVDPLTELPQTKVEEPSVAQLTPSNASPSLNQTDSTLAQEAPAAGNTTTNSSEVLQQINRYNNDADSEGQVTNVTQLRDVSPNDWAYEALRSLVERYGCIAGYPDGTYRGNRAMSRYEFAAGLNACLQQVERLIASNTADFVRKEDLAVLQRLIDEFRTELTTLGTRVDRLEGRVAFLENHQFSTTTKLVGEAIFNVADLFGGEDRFGNDYVRDETVFDYRVRLNFDTSFTGKDLLRTRLQAANITEFGPLTGPTTPGGNITREGRFGFQADTGSSVEIDRLFYRFPIADLAVAHIFANRGQYEDFIPVLNPGLDSSGTGALSRFGRFSPIYRMGGQGTGAGLAFGTKGPIRLDLAYLTDEGPNPSEGAGLFDGNYSALAQLTFKPIKQFT